MPRYRVVASVAGSKYIGEFEAPNEEAAETLAWESEDTYVSVCHQCSHQVEDPEISELFLELIEE